MSWLQDLGCVILQTSKPQGIVGNLLWGLEPTYNPTYSENIQQGKEYMYLSKDQSNQQFYTNICTSI